MPIIKNPRAQNFIEKNKLHLKNEKKVSSTRDPRVGSTSKIESNEENLKKHEAKSLTKGLDQKIKLNKKVEVINKQNSVTISKEIDPAKTRGLISHSAISSKVIFSIPETKPVNHCPINATSAPKPLTTCPFKATTLKSFSDNRSFSESFHANSVKGSGCSPNVCKGSVLKEGIIKIGQLKNVEEAKKENLDF